MSPRALRIGVLAGEASGDILAASVVSALRESGCGVQLEGIGGPLLQAQGLDSMFPMERLSVMGFTEPLARLPELLRIRGAVYRHFRDNPPDLFLGVDAPDFNLRLERKLRERGIRTAHLVSPTVWAWRQGRLRGIGRAVDLMLCLFPFETKIYADNGIPAVFVGHPMADEMADTADAGVARRALGLTDTGPLLAILPGSRGGEVARLAPLFLQAAQRLRDSVPALQFVLPAASPERAAQLAPLLTQFPDLPVTVTEGRAREAMAAADAVLLASGTATLETMLVGRPMVVAYRMGGLSWWLVSRLVKTPWAALPNVLSASDLVPEFLQDAATPQVLADAVLPLLEPGPARDTQLEAFNRMRADLRCDFGATCARELLRLVAGETTAEGVGG
ncbi:lipid-A-disaccharide synthase [Mangrovimicrobium sediminis]|uniref:Lipid-A-disaccharide synthase n=1 Tax=Mangrovimicrobium sediminis TaxID=2562682 RepID=A0A4Z0M3H3_9GAMM|nr:lipid-A-disaccharide synthase [Haliea sp. SAOS-164]TGD74079.1 lipid-A-disaccharide synthase [Haliea sp. SAOS-164]